MKKSSRLLLIKNHRESAFARTWIVDTYGLHSRTIVDATMLGNVLRGEQFDVVLLDQRGSDAGVIDSIAAVRQIQQSAHLIVVGDAIELSEIKQAMRFNVHDIFLPPFDALPVVARVEIDMAKASGTRPVDEADVPARWADLVDTLNGATPAAAIAASLQNAAGGAAGDASLSLEEKQAREIASLRAELEQSFVTTNKLAEEMQKLSAAATSQRLNEIRLKDLEAELAALRTRSPVAGGDQPSAEASAELEAALLRIAELDAARKAMEEAVTAETTVLRSEIDSQAAIIAALENRLATSAGTGGNPKAGSGQLASAAARIRELESQLAEADIRFEAAGQAFATELERVSSQQPQSPATQRSAASNEDAAAMRSQREAIAMQEGALRELAQMLDQRETSLTERAAQLATLGTEIEADTARLLQDAAELAVRVRQIENRRKEIGGLVAKLRE